MIEEGELLTLIAAMVGVALLYIMVPRHRKHVWFFLASYMAITLAAIFTVAEGFALPVLFNRLEHVSRATAAVLFAAGVAGMIIFTPKREDDE
jgi:hypothetical protein